MPLEVDAQTQAQRRGRDGVGGPTALGFKSTVNLSLPFPSEDDRKEIIKERRRDEEVDEEEEEEEMSETSSIGACSSADEEEEEEVQSKRSQSPLGTDDDDDQNRNQNQSDTSKKSSLSSLDSLEDSLPFKRGLSNFYAGKSKSFTSLSQAANATVKDIVKPDNPFNKRRRLLIACSRNRRASCSSLVSIAESSLLPLQPLPPVVSECDEEDEEAEESLEQADQTSPSSSPSSSSEQRMMMKKEKRRPSLFTVAVTRFEPDRDPFPTPKSVRGSSNSSKMALKSSSRSFSLSDLNRHADPHPMPDLD